MSCQLPETEYVPSTQPVSALCRKVCRHLKPDCSTVATRECGSSSATNLRPNDSLSTVIDASQCPGGSIRGNIKRHHQHTVAGLFCLANQCAIPISAANRPACLPSKGYRRGSRTVSRGNNSCSGRAHARLGPEPRQCIHRPGHLRKSSAHAQSRLDLGARFCKAASSVTIGGHIDIHDPREEHVRALPGVRTQCERLLNATSDALPRTEASGE